VLKPLDRSRRDGPLYPGSINTVGDFIDAKALLGRIDANFDFAALVIKVTETLTNFAGLPHELSALVGEYREGNYPK
jgi:hypothetical protein